MAESEIIAIESNVNNADTAIFANDINTVTFNSSDYFQNIP